MAGRTRFEGKSWTGCIAIAAAVLLGAIAALPAPVLAQGPAASAPSPDKGGNKAPEPAKEVPVEKLMAPGLLPDVSIGKPDAPITIVEYASLTCGHCGHFHRELLPKLKAKYIDKGIVRLIVREFPLENFALAAAIVARCTEPAKTYEATRALFVRQKTWMTAKNPRAALLAIGKEFGLSEAKFDACLDDKALIKKIIDSRENANKAFGVDATPTFFINGKRLVGPSVVDEFDTIIAPLLKK